MTSWVDVWEQTYNEILDGTIPCETTLAQSRRPRLGARRVCLAVPYPDGLGTVPCVCPAEMTAPQFRVRVGRRLRPQTKRDRAAAMRYPPGR
jgi:hypothetical protein